MSKVYIIVWGCIIGTYVKLFLNSKINRVREHIFILPRQLAFVKVSWKRETSFVSDSYKVFVAVILFSQSCGSRSFSSFPSLFKEIIISLQKSALRSFGRNDTISRMSSM